MLKLTPDMLTPDMLEVLRIHAREPNTVVLWSGRMFLVSHLVRAWRRMGLPL